MVQVILHLPPKAVGEIQQVVIGLYAGGGDQLIHVGDELLFAHIGFRRDVHKFWLIHIEISF